LVTFYLVIFAILLVAQITFTETYALTQPEGEISVEIKPGETRVFTWGLASDKSEDIKVELFAIGKGSEFLSFPQTISISAWQAENVQVTVSIPFDYPGDVELNPAMYAEEPRTSSFDIGARAVKTISIKISPNENPNLIEYSSGEDKMEDKIVKQIIKSPKKQMKSGVNTVDVTCKQGLELILKTTDGSAACVKPATASTLIERGWAKLNEVKQETFDPELVASAKKNIPILRSLPEELLEQCENVNSASDFRILVVAVASMKDDLTKSLYKINLLLTSLELQGYDEHPEVGPLITETRSIAVEASECIKDLAKKYGS